MIILKSNYAVRIDKTDRNYPKIYEIMDNEGTVGVEKFCNENDIDFKILDENDFE